MHWRRWVACACLMALPASAVTNAPPAKLAAEKLTDRAARLEREGNAVEAIAAYERIAREDPTRRRVVAHRLVRLYAVQKQAEPALRWARELMRDHPDPQAFYAGILTMLERYAEAEAVLRKELATAGATQRKVVLHWQLADCLEKAGKRDAAEAELRGAVTAAEGTIHAAAAARRLERFSGQPQSPDAPRE